MASPCSQDLRDRVLGAYGRGVPTREIGGGHCSVVAGLGALAVDPTGTVFA